ncbi:MAG: hypothetical protein K2G45_00380 [Lachnospiraceae bacterium]|nr:hypothetical protein [Lachnospiraceae bacterium]
MKSSLKSIVLYTVLLMVVVLHPFNVMAASGSVSVGVSSSTVSEGDTVSVTVSISADEAIGYGVAISYDSSVLEYTGGADGGGGGTVTLVSEGDGSSSSFSRTISFKAISNGSSSISASSYAGGLFGYSSGDVSTSYGASSVTVAEPVTTEATTTEQVTESTTGDTQETEKTTEATTEGTTSEDTTEDAGEPVAVINGKEYLFVLDKEIEGIPESFKPIDIKYRDWTVTAFQSPKKILLLVCLSDNKNNIEIYIFDKENETFTPYREYMADENKYVILEFPKDIKIPDGFERATLKLGKEKYDVYILKGTNIYLIYAMNIDKETGLYLYDSSENTFMSYMGDALIEAQKQPAEATPEATADEANFAKLETTEDEGWFSKKMLTYYLIGAGIFIFILLVIIIVMVVKIEKVKAQMDETEEVDEDGNTLSNEKVVENKKNMENDKEKEINKEDSEDENEKNDKKDGNNNIVVPEIALPIINKPKEVNKENNENKIDG